MAGSGPGPCSHGTSLQPAGSGGPGPCSHGASLQPAGSGGQSWDISAASW